MSDLVEALREARESYVREDYASNVKKLFREQFEELEPDAQIEDTLYFNHSAIPDFKLTWGRGAGGKSSRDVFLRSSYAAVVAGNETTRITTGDPVFLSISSDQTVKEPGFVMTAKDVARAARQSNHVLLTDAEAFREMAAPVADTNPLSAIVRSNFLRGARGLVDEPIAELLRSAGQDSNGNVAALIRENFFEDAVTRMERTALLVQWALSPETLAGELPDINGSMSTDELRSVLPWLLSQESLPEREGFWKALGSLFTLEQLEDLAPDLDGVDLTNLVQANLSTWSARRAYLGLKIYSEDRVGSKADPKPGADATAKPTAVDADFEVGVAPSERVGDQYAWQFDSGTLGFTRGAFMVRVSNSGHKLQARPGSSTPKWSDTGDRLADYTVRSVSVAGIARAFRVDAKENGDIKEDVDKVVESVEDTYFVDRLEVLLPSPLDPNQQEADYETVTVDFAGGIAIATGAVQVGALVRATVNIIGREQLGSDLKA